MKKTRTHEKTPNISSTTDEEKNPNLSSTTDEDPKGKGREDKEEELTVVLPLSNRMRETLQEELELNCGGINGERIF